MTQVKVPGTKWGEREKAEWLEQQRIQRSYADEVVAKIDALDESFNVHQYGELDYSHLNQIAADKFSDYPLFALHTKNWDNVKPSILITGGVHGYETSGVQGALRFLQSTATDYQEHFNFVIVPCISPWGYETINRWNPQTVDPNRSFRKPSSAQEAASIMAYIDKLKLQFLAHIDLHETTDTDNSVFRPALASRDGIKVDVWNIPDGFYLVADSENPVPDFQRAIIKSVEKVTHIAEADAKGEIVGDKVEQHGVINYERALLGLCAGFNGVNYASTTEVYPDSPRVTDETCILAQVAAIKGALDYLVENELN